MDRGRLLRLIIHLSTPAYLVYYFLPNPLWPGGISPQLGVIIVLIFTLALEFLRLTRKWRILGMREYEARQISAAAWAGVALTITFLFFPIEYAAPVLFGMAIVDPLISAVRKTRMYPIVPIAVYFFIALILMSLLIGPTLKIAVASLVAALIAVAVESPKSSWVDDDFLMIVVPLIGLEIFFDLTSSWSF